jgi:very-short-patch-repair endonuclease
MNKCKFCGKEASFQRKDGSWCCFKNPASCPEIKKKMSKNHADVNGPNNPMYGKKLSVEAIASGVEKRKGLIPWNKGLSKIYKKETLLIMSEKRIEAWKDPNSKYNTKEIRILWSNQRKGRIAWNKSKKGIFTKKSLEKISISSKNSWGIQRRFDQSMLLKLGLCIKMIKSIKKISNEEVIIRDMIKQLYPNCIFQQPVFNYSIDVALLEYKIGIEYDGWYHFNCQESLDYYKKREEKIISQGWTMIHYTMFKKLPTLEEIKNDIEKIIYSIDNPS